MKKREARSREGKKKEKDKTERSKRRRPSVVFLSTSDDSKPPLKKESVFTSTDRGGRLCFHNSQLRRK